MRSSDPDTRAHRAIDGLREHERDRKPRFPERYAPADELGRGGMAIVYRARDAQLDREVALKVMRDDLHVDPADRARFRREAEAAAKLSHPNVVTVFDAGEDYLVMELVRGRPLSAVLADRPDAKTVAVLLEKVGRAVHAAHEQGIVHRDLKPANIFVTEAGEPKVADFGIAHLLGDRTALTQSGVVVGTPQYMAPEQVEGRRADMSPRTDVYALGAILYEALAGRPPFAAETPLELFGKIVNADPAPIPGASTDLETIARKALEKNPGRRFASALAFAEDLGRWREGLPILARPASAFYRFRKRLARQKALTASIGAAFGVFLVAVAVFVPKLIESRRALRLWSDVSVILHESDLYARTGDVDRARTRLEQGIDLCRGAESADARYFLGRLLRQRGRRDEAVAALTSALERNPRLGEANFERGLVRVEEYAARAERIRSVFAGRPPGSGSVEPPSGDALESLHPELIELKKMAEKDLAVQVGESAYFRKVDALFGAAELARLRWEWDDAIRGYEAVLDAESVYVQARLALAELEFYRNRFDEAIRHAEKAADQHRGLGRARLVLGRARFWKAERDPLSAESIALRARAREDLETAVDLLEEKAAAWAARADLLLRTGETEAAIADYTRAIEADPRDAIAHNHRGVARVARNELDTAVADFSEAIRLSPGYAMAWANRARVKALLGDVGGAKSDAERALAAAPPNAPYRGEIERFLDFLKSADD